MFKQGVTNVGLVPRGGGEGSGKHRGEHKQRTELSLSEPVDMGKVPAADAGEAVGQVRHDLFGSGTKDATDDEPAVGGLEV